jgi:hypothetical protein
MPLKKLVDTRAAWCKVWVSQAIKRATEQNETMKTAKRKLIGLVGCFGKLEPCTTFGQTKEISVSIAILDDKGRPNNWRRDREFPSETGGQRARIFACDSGFSRDLDGNLFSNYGPDISYCDSSDEYLDAGKMLAKVAKRISDMYAVRGNAVDAAESMGRWLEACGVTEVYMRPGNDRETWLTEGEWKILTIGYFVQKVRENLFRYPAREVESVAS